MSTEEFNEVVEMLGLEKKISKVGGYSTILYCADSYYLIYDNPCVRMVVFNLDLTNSVTISNNKSRYVDVVSKNKIITNSKEIVLSLALESSLKQDNYSFELDDSKELYGALCKYELDKIRERITMYSKIPSEMGLVSSNPKYKLLLERLDTFVNTIKDFDGTDEDYMSLLNEIDISTYRGNNVLIVLAIDVNNRRNYVKFEFNSDLISYRVSYQENEIVTVVDHYYKTNANDKNYFGENIQVTYSKGELKDTYNYNINNDTLEKDYRTYFNSEEDFRDFLIPEIDKAICMVDRLIVDKFRTKQKIKKLI